MKIEIALSVLMCTLLLSCSGNKQQIEERKGIPVRVLTAGLSQINDRHSYVGTIEETFSSSLSFSVAGNIERIYVREGEKVIEGQLIAVLDKTTFKDSYNAALSTLNQAKDAYNRMKILYDNKSLPEIKWIEAQTSLQQAKSLESIARKNLNNCSLYAPFSGVISERMVESGAYVLPGAPVFKLITIDKIKVKVAIPEKVIGKIHVGQPAIIHIEALNKTSIEGKVSDKGVTANPLSHTYEVKIAINNRNTDIMPGMVCNVNIDMEDTNTLGFIIPPNSILTNHDGKNFVWLAKENQAHRREVQVSGFTNNGTIVSEGISVGEQIIVEGYQKVSEGMKIIIR